MSGIVPQTDIDASNVVSPEENQDPQTIMVAVDGSRVSRKALDTASTLCQGTGKNLIVYHVFNPRKTGIPGYYSADYLEIELENTCYEAGLKMKQFEICIESRGENGNLSNGIA